MVRKKNCLEKSTTPPGYIPVPSLIITYFITSFPGNGVIVTIDFDTTVSAGGASVGSAFAFSFGFFFLAPPRFS